jgi:hypothetical protein
MVVLVILLSFLYAAVMFVVVARYLYLVHFLMSYLRRTHSTLWMQLGRPEFSKKKIQNLNGRSWFVLMGTLKFVLLSPEYKDLDDLQFNKLIWSIRVLFFLFAFGLVLFVPIFTYWR